MATPNTMEAHWPPLLVIHGDADAVVSPKNGQAAAQVWALVARAKASEARSVQRGQRYPMSVTDFKRKGSTVATLVAVSRLAHAWSGGLADDAPGAGSPAIKPDTDLDDDGKAPTDTPKNPSI